MLISLLGATGMVGSAILTEATARGHQVAAYTRTGSAPGTKPLELGQTQELLDIINASDLTVIAVAGRDNYDAVVAAHRALIAAAPTGRLLIVGGAGALQAGDGLLLDSPDFPAEYLQEAQTFARVLADYRAADNLAWTMAAPSPLITPGVRTGQYKVALDTPAGMVVSAEDFAVAVVDEAENPQHTGRRFTVASADEAAAQG